MPQTASRTENAKVSAAALRLAAAKGWPKVTLEAVAKRTKIPLAKLKKHFAAPHDIIPVIASEITRKAQAAAGKTTGTPHDVLFDLLMARFDVLQKNRKAILSITDSAQRDPGVSSVLARAIWESLYATVDAAKLDRFPRPILAAGISAAYAFAFIAWRRDTRPGMPKTMATLDRALRLIDKVPLFPKQSS